MQGFLGTPFTASIGALNEDKQSRRDDLESLGYCFMFVISPKTITWAEDTTKESIKAKKIDFVNSFTKNVPEEFESVHKFI